MIYLSKINPVMDPNKRDITSITSKPEVDHTMALSFNISVVTLGTKDVVKTPINEPIIIPAGAQQSKLFVKQFINPFSLKGLRSLNIKKNEQIVALIKTYIPIND
ncbi:MAG: hypothetical protein WA101_02680 [Minisyncoccia bacterium]